MANGQVMPPAWEPEELTSEAARATQEFIRERLEEPSREYEELFTAKRDRLGELAERTRRFSELSADVITEDKSWVEEYRYLAGPPISADDLRTLVGSRLGRQQLSEAEAEAIVRIVVRTLDPFRFPWVPTGRTPRDGEVESAVAWTAGLLAVERLRTNRRVGASVDQESMVRKLLANEGFSEVERPARELHSLDQLERGTFTGELKLAGQKADIPVRLRDGRMLAIECKVSNSAVNSIKRLINDAGSKADSWKAEFGRQVVPCAVISGVYDVSTLLNAQGQKGLFIVWQHDLQPLSEFIRAAAG